MFLAYFFAILLPMLWSLWDPAVAQHAWVNPLGVRLYRWVVTSIFATGIGMLAAAIPFVVLVGAMLRPGLRGFAMCPLAGAAISFFAFATVGLLLGGRLIGGVRDQLMICAMGAVAGVIFRLIATDDIRKLLFDRGKPFRGR